MSFKMAGGISFDELPAHLREAIFLLLPASDLDNCRQVNKSWSEFISVEILQSRRNKDKAVALALNHKRAFSNTVTECEALFNTIWMLPAYDDAENKLYVLTKPMSGGNDWSLKQYDCADGLRQLNEVTFVTSHFVRNIKIFKGLLLAFKLKKEGEHTNHPAVFRTSSIPWGGSMSIEAGIPLPEPAFHFRKLLPSKESMFFVSKNAHVTWTKKRGEEGFSESTHEAFAEAAARPVVVQRYNEQADTWQDVAKLLPEHSFKVMETTPNIPSREVYAKYAADTCLLLLSCNIITDRHMLVCCPLHGSYEFFDLSQGASMWRLNMTTLPFENIRAILRDSQNFSSHVLAAIRDAYVFIYAEPGKATLVSVESGVPMRHVQGENFVLSPRYVLPVVVSCMAAEKKGMDVAVVDASSGDKTSTFTFKTKCVSMDAYGDKPWHHDDKAYGNFEAIANQLWPSDHPKWPVFEDKAESYWGCGHAMIDSVKMVCWTRESANEFKVKLCSLRLPSESS